MASILVPCGKSLSFSGCKFALLPSLYVKKGYGNADVDFCGKPKIIRQASKGLIKISLRSSDINLPALVANKQSDNEDL